MSATIPSGKTDLMIRRLGLSVLAEALAVVLAFFPLFAAPVSAQTDSPNREENVIGDRPDLSGLPANEANAIERACSNSRQYQGPGEYYQCLQRELAALQKSGGRPDLSGLPASEVSAIERACSNTRQYQGPGEYYQCLRRELTELQKSGVRPELSGLPGSEANAIERACSNVSQYQGLGDYYQCLKRGLAALKKFLSPSGSKGLKTEGPATEPAAPAIGASTVGKGEQTGQESLQGEKSAGEHAETPEEEGPGSSSPPPQSSRPTDTDWPLQESGTGFFLAALGFIILFLAGRAIYKRVSTRRCIHCDTRTKNNTRLCDLCQRLIDNETAKAQERERLEDEARAKAEEIKRQEEARAEEQRKRDEEARRKKPASVADLQQLTGHEFESLIASLFERDGYKIKRGGSGNGGMDLILHFGPEKGAVQCKRWQSSISSPVISDFYSSLMRIGAGHGFIVTTASFSRSAKEFAVEKPIVLIDGRYLLGWMNGARSARIDASARKAGSGFNPYEVLQVKRGASQEEIKAAYLKLIKQYHPDMVSHLGKEFQDIANEKAQAINRAYRILASR